jgi:hypothetical protein
MPLKGPIWAAQFISDVLCEGIASSAPIKSGPPRNDSTRDVSGSEIAKQTAIKTRQKEGGQARHHGYMVASFQYMLISSKRGNKHATQHELMREVHPTSVGWF